MRKEISNLVKSTSVCKYAMVLSQVNIPIAWGPWLGLSKGMDLVIWTHSRWGNITVINDSPRALL